MNMCMKKFDAEKNVFFLSNLLGFQLSHFLMTVPSK